MTDHVSVVGRSLARAYCRKHAFARFSRNVSPGTQFQGCSPRSRHVSYDLQPSLAVERSVGRYYDPQTGQFLGVDPLVDETGEPYAYTGGDSVDQNGTSMRCARQPLPQSTRLLLQPKRERIVTRQQD
jgi:hypothetical protein